MSGAAVALHLKTDIDKVTWIEAGEQAQDGAGLKRKRNL